MHASARPATTLERVGAMAGGSGFSAYLVAYRHAGLRLHALVAVPLTPAPPQGYPVLVANHGFHPDPARYGITPDGRDWRPGNYYRPVPAAYAAVGFLVIMPDYRGHNTSDGRQFTTHPLAISYYADDVTALLAGLNSIAQADSRNVFLWGHSMGGPVALKAALAAAQSQIVIRGVSLWSTSESDDDLARLPMPLMLQHAADDQSTNLKNSERLASALKGLGKTHALHTYSGSDHFFTGTQFEAAVQRDIAFFRSLMASAAAR